MSPSPLEFARLVVLSRYRPLTDGLHWTPLGSGGGFSGAEIWRGDDPTGQPVFALKAWPPESMTALRLAQIHAWTKRAGHLPFVPTVVPTSDQSTLVVEASRVWDLTHWMPGVADFHSNPTPARLADACAALARIHQIWAGVNPSPVRCPAVGRRLMVLRAWADRRDDPPVSSCPSVLVDLVRSGRQVVDRLANSAEQILRHWSRRLVPVQPCLCDIWHDHVLFTGGSVTGVIDFGAMKEDWVGVDLARLLGDLIEDDDAAFHAGLEAYQQAGGAADLRTEFVRDLDRTGVVCALIGWVLRVGIEGRQYPNSAAVAVRMARLISRLAAFPGT